MKRAAVCEKDTRLFRVVEWLRVFSSTIETPTGICFGLPSSENNNNKTKTRHPPFGCHHRNDDDDDDVDYDDNDNTTARFEANTSLWRYICKQRKESKPPSGIHAYTLYMYEKIYAYASV